MYEIMDIPKPENLPAKRAGDTKYPFADMKVGSSFVVPFSDMRDNEAPEKFRDRIYKSAREYARRDFNTRKKDNPAVLIERKEFTAALMPSDDKNQPMRYAAGDVVVWRDK
jgi:ectoine hydroxylase-related dioxygenase (phytanoyl-CoA dioxygenase family)